VIDIEFGGVSINKLWWAWWLTITASRPLFFVCDDCEGVEIICFDTLLQVLILRDLAVNNLQGEVEELSRVEGGSSG
jgi:hypothetical protein